jgi:hypothetical protein
MRFLGIVLATMLMTGSLAHAGFQGINGSTSLGVFNKLTCSTGLTCTKSKDAFSIVSSPSITGSPLAITANSATAATIDLKANANASNGDDWQLKSTTSQGGLQFLNNTSGSLVNKLSLDTSGNLTTVGTLTSTGIFTPTGGIAASATTKTIYGNYSPGAVANATSATPDATHAFVSQGWVPHNMTVTGVAVLNGGTCGTNKWIVALYDSAGNVLANSSTAGTLCSGASGFQKINFTAPISLVAPRTIWVALYADGGTDRYYSVPALGAQSGLAGSVASTTFGTVAALVLPTTFTADKGPIWYTY